MPKVAVAVVRCVTNVTNEDEAAHDSRTVRVERTRPVAAVGTGIAELTTVVDASSGQED